MFVTNSFFWVKIAALLFGFSSGFFVANVFSSLYDLVSRINFAFATGLLNMVGGIGGGAAILSAGLAKDHDQIGSIMLGSSVCSIVAAAHLFLCTRRALLSII